MSGENKKWKDFLLSSGLPLEYSVYTTLDSLGLSSFPEYNYERVNEAGLTTNFSVDFKACDFKSKNNFRIDLLVECKYRHPGTNWFFFPEKPYTGDYICSFMFSDYSECYSYQDFNVDDYFMNLQHASKGIEIIDNSFNPKSIKQGISQLEYAFINKIFENYQSEFDPSKLIKYPFCLIPILVTTADLWVLKENISIENIRDSENIEEVADSKDILYIKHNIDYALKRYSYSKINNLHPNILEEMKEIYKKNFPNANSENNLDIVAEYAPDAILIIKYSALKEHLGKLLEVLRKQKLTKKGNE